MTFLERIRNHPAVSEIFQEDNDNSDYPGKRDYWVYLKTGFQNGNDPGVHSIHEWTISRVYSELRQIIPCNCDNCERNK